MFISVENSRFFRVTDFEIACKLGSIFVRKSHERATRIAQLFECGEYQLEGDFIAIRGEYTVFPSASGFRYYLLDTDGEPTFEVAPRANATAEIFVLGNDFQPIEKIGTMELN